MEKKHKPYISSHESVAEFTIKAVVVGVIFGVLFGAANAYLGLLVGITVSTSIPVAVMTVGFFKLTRSIFGKGTILESNIAQTTGSASSSLASGIIFTVPALFLWGMEPTLFQMAALAMIGGLLGILFMIPLRRFLIKEEHGNLPYPEGTACAQVLIASESGGARASNVFYGLGLGLIYKLFVGFLMLWPDKVSLKIPFIRNAVLGLKATPALLGVGYILGFRISAIMVAGGLISWLLLIPMITYFSQTFSFLFPEGAPAAIATMEATEIWTKYIRYIGAGGVAFGGIITIIKSFPMMIKSFKIAVSEMTKRMGKNKSSNNNNDDDQIERVDHDIPFKYVIIGVIGIIGLLIAIPSILGEATGFSMRMVAAPAIAIFAFFFVMVSSRIVGLIGVSSNPTSGMTIVTLLGVSGVFVMMGWTDMSGMVTALTIGTVVCVAASIAGDTSQDLKTGFLVGATPYKQQIGELIGAVTSAFAVCAAVILLAHTYQFGSPELPAPQATLMKTIIEGVLSSNVPWGLVMIGVVLAAGAEMLKIPSLPFAVGLYLPVSSMTPIFVGGLIKRIIEKKFSKDETALEGAKEKGILFCSGLIGGEGLLGVGIALYAFYFAKPQGIGWSWPEPLGQIFAAVIFGGLAYLIYKLSTKKDKITG